MSSLELAPGRPRTQARARKSRWPGPAALTAALRWPAAVLHRSALLIALLVVWELAPRLELADPAFLPRLSDVLEAGWELALNGQLWEHIEASLFRILSGFAIAVVLFVPLGLAMGWYARLGKALNQIIEVLRNTAPLALLPVFILLLGIGELSKVTMVIYSCAWPLLLNTIAAVRQVDPLLVKSARTMGASQLQLFVKVILPASLPLIFVGVRLASASAMLVLIASEMIGAKAGLGYLVIYAQYSFLIPQMYFGILAITALGVLSNHALVSVERRLMRWRPPPASM
jgi:NitT/TauT family transport system permease protein